MTMQWIRTHLPSIGHPRLLLVRMKTTRAVLPVQPRAFLNSLLGIYSNTIVHIHSNTLLEIYMQHLGLFNVVVVGWIM
jgi:hypothetical protein